VKKRRRAHDNVCAVLAALPLATKAALVTPSHRTFTRPDQSFEPHYHEQGEAVGRL